MIELISDGPLFNAHNKRYIIDAASELDSLDVEFGNEAYCIADKTTYICDGSGTYVEKATSGGGGGGSSLPAVTSEDNGDVLTVVDGEWNKATPASGGGKKYQHNISTQIPIYGGTAWAAFNIVNDNNTALDYDATAALLYSSGFTSSNKACSASGPVIQSNIQYVLNGVCSSNGTKIFVVFNTGAGIGSEEMKRENIVYFNDVVIEL